MTRKRRALLVVAGIVAVAGGVGCVVLGRGERIDFAPLAVADRVEVRLNSAQALRTINDPATIAALVAFAQAHPDGWDYPWYGAPVALLRADFYAGQRFVNDLEVGGDWIGTQFKGYWYSRSVSDDDRVALMKLLDVPDPYATPR